jgi:uncharacterized protein
VTNGIAILCLGFAGGAINAVAGGGAIVVVAALAVLGTPADIASLTSTVALLPGQLFAGWRGSGSLTPLASLRLRMVTIMLTLCGGGIGATLLLVTPSRVFAGMLPFLITFATVLYAWSSRRRFELDGAPQKLRPATVGWLAPLSVYGGFYGGGNSFMVLAFLARAHIAPRAAAHVKNFLILLMNAAATVIFLASGKVDASVAVPLGLGALVGGATGVALIDRLGPTLLRYVVIVLGTSLALWLMVRG